jgi:hypothetical protein
MDSRVEGIVKVQPFVGGRWFAEEGIILKGLFWIGSETVYVVSA